MQLTVCHSSLCALEYVKPDARGSSKIIRRIGAWEIRTRIASQAASRTETTADERGASPCGVSGALLRGVRAGTPFPPHLQGLPTADNLVLWYGSAASGTRRCAARLGRQPEQKNQRKAQAKKSPFPRAHNPPPARRYYGAIFVPSNLDKPERCQAPPASQARCSASLSRRPLIDQAMARFRNRPKREHGLHLHHFRHFDRADLEERTLLGEFEGRIDASCPDDRVADQPIRFGRVE